MTPPEEGGTFISSGQIYTELRRHSDLLVRITTQLEQGRYEERIGALERLVWRASGAAAVAGAGVGVLVQFLAR